MPIELAPASVRVEQGIDATPLGGNCSFERVGDHCHLIIFGATGDLVSRKLFPALYNLFLSNGLPENFAITGVSRTELTDEDFRGRMHQALVEQGADVSRWAEIQPRVHYRKVVFDDKSTFIDLADSLEALDAEHGLPGNRLFYLAVPPSTYEDISCNIGGAGMAREVSRKKGWVRLVVEKPFGHDLQSAQALDNSLHKNFREHQIFRIDHYLAKETVQNMIMLRFANSIFEPVWNRNYIDSVHITAAESIGVGHRAGYYDTSGVLRDMFQNHMMQLLALCAMEPPSRFEADRVRDEKTKVYRALRPFPSDGDLEEHLVLGQYASGTINDEKVSSYVDEPNVAKDSVTPTYASMKVFLDNWRWQGVPFVLTSGKRLAQKRTEIAVQFKQVPYSMFRHVLGDHISANRLILGIQPKEAITLTFQTKVPGPKMCLRSVTMNFNYNQGYEGPVLDAYEKVLLDCMLGDHTLFWRQDSVDLCWGFLTPVMERCDDSDRLHLYRAGSWGPRQAIKLLD